MSKLLIDEYPLQVLPSLAVAIGLNEAIVVQQVHYWTKGKSGKVFEGYRWIYNSYTEWKEQFPFWEEGTIGRAFRSAEQQGILLSRQQNNYDRRKWYRVDEDKLDEIITHHIKSEPSIISKVNDGSFTFDTLLTETTETTTETADTSADLLPKRKTTVQLKQRTLDAMKSGEGQNDSLVKAVETLTGRRYDKPTKTDAGLIFDLREWGATPDNFRHFSHYWQVVEKWRGPSSKPTLRDVRDKWDEVMKWQPNATPSKPAPMTPEQALAKARAARGL